MFKYNLSFNDYLYYISGTCNCSHHRAVESWSGRPQDQQLLRLVQSMGRSSESGAESTPFLPALAGVQSYQYNSPALGQKLKTQVGQRSGDMFQPSHVSLQAVMRNTSTWTKSLSTKITKVGICSALWTAFSLPTLISLSLSLPLQLSLPPDISNLQLHFD